MKSWFESCYFVRRRKLNCCFGRACFPKPHSQSLVAELLSPVLTCVKLEVGPWQSEIVQASWGGPLPLCFLNNSVSGR